MPEQFRPRGVTMRDRLKSRAGFDRVLMAVAATFLTVSATSAFAQSDPARNSAAELAIDAAIPRPEPANVPPPTINDFKMDTTASVPDTRKPEAAKPTDSKTTEKTPEKAETKPADVVTAPISIPSVDTPRKDTAAAPAAPAPAAAAVTPAAEPPKEVAREPTPEPVKAASSVPAADQPVADRLKDMLGGKSLRYFDRKAERAAVEKFYGAREFAPLWTQSGALTEQGK